MSEEAENLSPWRKKFLATRMTYESLLFERELVAPVKERKHSGLLVLLAVFLLHSLLLTQAVLRGGGNFPGPDAAALETAHAYAQAVDSGSYARLFKPELSGVSGFRPPLYFLSFYPALKLFPSNPALALAAVNSFYLLLLMLSMYYAVRKGRNAPSAWFAASMAAAFPFVISAGRHASPDMALLAFTAGLYCCYINSEDFEHRGWSFLFGAVFSLGLLTDVRFLISSLPLAVFALNAFLNPRTRRNITPFYVFLLLLPAPWYLRNFAFSFLGDLFIGNDLAAAAGLGALNPLNLLRDLPLALGCMHLPLFLVGVGALVWLWLSVFMVYEEKEVVLAWFLFPYCAFSLFSRAGGGNLYPALLPFALAAGIMTPNKLRKVFLGLTLLLPVLYQSGFVPAMPVSAGGKRTGLFGMDLVRGGDLRLQEALQAAYAAGGGRKLRVQLVGEDAYFNPDSLKLLARKSGFAGMTFVRYPKDFMGLADLVIYKSAGFSTHYGEGPFREYSEEIAAPGGWFSSVFSPAASFDAADTSRLTVYAKAGPRPETLEPGNYSFEKLSFGGFSFEDAIVDVGPYSAAAGTYGFYEIFIPHFRLHGADLYSLRFRFEGLSLLPVTRDFTDIRLTGCDTVRILSLKMREETLGAFLKASSPFFENLTVKLQNELSILGTYRNIGVNLGFAVKPTGAGFKLKLTRMLLGGLGSEFGGGGEEVPPEAEAPAASGKEAAGFPEPPAGQEKAKELSQYTGDAAVTGALKTAGYEKLVRRAAEAAKQEKWIEKAPERPAPPPPSLSSGSVLSSFLVRLFSMDLDFLDEKSVPFKVKVAGLSLRNGMLVVRSK